MNIERLIRMASRRFMRKIMNRGINAGIDYAARRGSDPQNMTPEEKQQARAAKQTARKARQGAKLLRRIGRM